MLPEIERLCSIRLSIWFMLDLELQLLIKLTVIK